MEGLQKLKTELQHNLAIPPLSISMKKMKTSQDEKRSYTVEKRMPAKHISDKDWDEEHIKNFQISVVKNQKHMFKIRSKT